MGEFTMRERREAKNIVDHLLAGDGDDFDFKMDELSIADVEADAIRFREEMELLEDAGMGAPALLIDSNEWIPVSLSMLWGAGSPFALSPYFSDVPWPGYLHRAISDLAERAGYNTIPTQVARQTFTEKATEFLAARIAGVKDRDSLMAGPNVYLNVFRRLRGTRISTPGCTFTVTTNNRGLRVLWSGAYYISGNYFGHPTFPVTSVMMAGTYVFGVDGGAYGSTVQWDHSKCMLPGRPSVHLNF